MVPHDPHTTAAALPAAAARRARRGFLGWMLSPERRGPLLIAPALATLFIVNIFPLMWSFGLSFFAYKANRMRPAASSRASTTMPSVLTDPEIWDALPEHRDHRRSAA